MAVGRFPLVLSCSCLMFALIIYFTVDWRLLGRPTAPEILVEADGRIRIIEFAVGSTIVRENEGLQLDWSQTVDVTVRGCATIGSFKTYARSSGFQEKSQHSKVQADLAALSFRVEFLRESSKSPGLIVVSKTFGGTKCNEDGSFVWSRKIWVPNVPGAYRIRVTAISSKNTQGDESQSKETIVGSYLANIVPTTN